PALAEFALTTQLETVTASESHQTPPPVPFTSASPSGRVPPLDSVKPISAEFRTSETHRTELESFDQFPRIMVTSGPLTLCNVSGDVTATRLLNTPEATRPPA